MEGKLIAQLQRRRGAINMNLEGRAVGFGTDLSPPSAVNMNLGGGDGGSSVGEVVDGSRQGGAHLQVTRSV
ncbi:hypothetical protein RHGRI_005240 [Rhododendron griersonianum]|uniref:Uncharacterized protein n=1 Tax=Rhododendron griersonianum TaxID=479676 RepID=A0AAV6I0E7_9ERIC|nr:hypothetical protein RHGRI_033574 [Rhododendron griersonianum]KAG5562435.1 hypothetical protein RHGRI_005240 [Rhododendron griersonianum]